MTDATESFSEKKARNLHPDRFTVDPPHLEKIGRLLDQLRLSVRACKATRKDMLNWIVEKFPDELSPADLQDLSDRFYDEERFLKLALEEVRAAKARGEKQTLEEILKGKLPGMASPTKLPRKRKARAETEPSVEGEAKPTESS